jgi:hypothetical protein
VKFYVLDGVFAIWLFVFMRYYTEYAQLKMYRSYLSVRSSVCPHDSSTELQKELRWGKSDFNLYPLALALPEV